MTFSGIDDQKSHDPGDQPALNFSDGSGKKTIAVALKNGTSGKRIAVDFG